MVVIVPFANGLRHEVIKIYTSTMKKTIEAQWVSSTLRSYAMYLKRYLSAETRQRLLHFPPELFFVALLLSLPWEIKTIELEIQDCVPYKQSIENPT
jgi:hypothetical protein